MDACRGWDLRVRAAPHRTRLQGVGRHAGAPAAALHTWRVRAVRPGHERAGAGTARHGETDGSGGEISDRHSRSASRGASALSRNVAARTLMGDVGWAK